MVGIVADGTTTSYPIVFCYVVFSGVNNGRSGIAEVETRTVGIKGLARLHRQGLERLEA